MKVLLPHRALGLTIRSSTARRNRITVHSLLVLRPVLLVLRISHTYLLLISRLVANTSQATQVNLTPRPRPIPPINLLRHHRPDLLSSGMAIAGLVRPDPTQDHNTRALPQSCPIGSNHYLLYRLPSLRLRDLPIRRLLLRLHHSHQVGMHSHLLAQHLRNRTRREPPLLEIQGKEYPVARLPCIINYLLYRTIHRTVVLAFRLQLSIAGLWV